jgi:DNA-directed RNA polymerase specialized sigma24 family protein
MSSGSVTHWIGLLRAGDEAAAQRLWERYFRQLVFLARQRLQGLPRRAADEEDVALSAFNSFCQDARHGRFPQLADRDDLWRLLVTLTASKAVDLARREQAQKRGGHLAASAGDEVEAVLGHEPTPEFAAQVAESCQRLLEALGEELRSIAVWKMEGYTNDEIAARLGCVPRTVERRVRVIRSVWTDSLGEDCP